MPAAGTGITGPPIRTEQPPTLTAYAATWLLQRIGGATLAVNQPFAERWSGVLLVVDTPGLVPGLIAQQISPEPDAQRLTQRLKLSLGAVVEIVVAHGGDIISFTSDCLVALWPTRPWTVATDSPGGPAPYPAEFANAAQRACSCSLRIQGSVPGLAHGQGGDLALRQFVTAGSGDFLSLGGELSRWALLLHGAPLAEVAQLRRRATMGDILVSQHISDCIPGGWLASRAGAGFRLEPNLQPRPWPPRPALDPPELAGQAQELLRQWLPGALRSGLPSPDSDGELRRVSMVVVGLPACHGQAVNLDALQATARALQRDVYQVEGSLDRITMDGEDPVLIAVFGVPPIWHEDDPARAVQAGLAMRNTLRKKGLPASVGIATGLVLCGSVGSATRREYLLVGQALRTAKTLQLVPGDQVVCDEETWRHAREFLGFDPLPSPSLFALPLPANSGAPACYVANGQRLPPLGQAAAMVGRVPERALLSTALQSLVKFRQNSTVLLTGPAGSGKSRLLEDALQQATGLGVEVLRARGDAREQWTAYRPFYPVFQKLLDLPNRLSPPATAEALRRRAAVHPAWLPLFPLLADAMPLDLQDNEWTRQMHGSTRAFQTLTLLCGLLQDQANRQPTLLVVDDAQWMDSRSWALLHAIRQSVSPIVVVVLACPVGDVQPADLDLLRTQRGVVAIDVQPLTAQESERLISQHLGVQGCPQELANTIHEWAAGNALNVEELTLLLRDGGLVQREGELVHLRCDIDELRKQHIPASLREVVLARLGLLPTDQQRALQMASVIGTSFPTSAVMEQLISEYKAVQDIWTPLLRRRWLRPLDGLGGENLALRFGHALIRPLIYDAIPDQLRSQWHRDTAHWLRNHMEKLAQPPYSLLAGHGQKGQMWPFAVENWQHAAAAAQARDAHPEALRALQTAQALTEIHSVPVTALQKAAWFGDMSQAWLRIGDWASAERDARRALAATGTHLPTSASGQWLAIVWQAAIRALQMGWPEWFGHAAAAKRSRFRWRVRLLQPLTEHLLAADQLRASLACGLKAVNCAVSGGPSDELACAYAMLGIVLRASTPWHRLAWRSLQAAMAVAQQQSQYGAKGVVLTRLAEFHLVQGQWSQAQAVLQQAVGLSHEIGDMRQWLQAQVLLCQLRLHQGRTAEITPIVEALGRNQSASNSPAGQAHGLLMQAQTALRLGDPAQAHAALAPILGWIEREALAAEVLWARALLALTHLQSGDRRMARAVADRALPLLQRANTSAPWLPASLSALCEVYLRLWADAEVTDPQRLDYVRHSRNCCLGLQRLSRHVAPAQPPALLWQGWRRQLQQRPAAALQAWREANAAARRLDMLFEQAMAQAAIGQCPATPTAEKQQAQQTAAAMFAEQKTFWLVGIGAEQRLNLASPKF